MKKIKKIITPNLNQALTPKLLGLAIQARRTQSNLRLEDAATLCGVAKQTLMNIEHGQTTGHFNKILQICTALGIQLAILPWQDENEMSDDWR